MFDSFCLPAKIYLILAITGVIVSLYNKLSIFYFIFSLLFIFLWTNLLNWLCNKGLTVLSWFLVFFPLLSSFLLVGAYMANKIHAV